MPYEQEDREWIEFQPDSTTDIILEKFWDKVKPNKNGPGFYRAHFYKGQRTSDQELIIFNATNTLHEKIMQTGAEVGATVAVTRVGKGKQDTRWMVKVPTGNLDQNRIDLWEHGDPDPFDSDSYVDPDAQQQPQQQRQTQQQPPAPPATPPGQNTQKEQPAPPSQPQGDPVYKVYVPKPDEFFNLIHTRIEETTRVRYDAFMEAKAKFKDQLPTDTSIKDNPELQLLKFQAIMAVSAPQNIDASQKLYHWWEAPGPRMILKEDLPDYQEPTDDVEDAEPQEKLEFQNAAEANAALALTIDDFFVVVAQHEFFAMLPEDSVNMTKKVANQFGFRLPSHLESVGQKLNIARFIYYYGDLAKDFKTEYECLMGTAEHFDFPIEVIDFTGVSIPEPEEKNPVQAEVEEALNGDTDV